MIAQQISQSHQHQKKKKRMAQEQYSISCHARNLGIPSSSSVISNSLLDWTKEILGMDSNNKKLPDPPTAGELSFLKNHISKKKKSITNAISSNTGKPNQQNSNPQLRQKELKLVKKDALRQLKQKISSKYPSLEATSIGQINSHDEKWISHARALIQNARIPKCTYHLEQNPKSSWNSSLTAIIIRAWEMYHERGGTSAYSITKNDKTPANRVGIINCWLLSKKAFWKKERKVEEGSRSRNSNVSASQSLNKKKLGQMNILKLCKCLSLFNY